MLWRNFLGAYNKSVNKGFIMEFPSTYTDKNETGCCAIPNVADWDKRDFDVKDVHFIRAYTRSLLFMPLNMSTIVNRLNDAASRAGVMMPSEHAMILSRDLSPWKAEQLYRVTQPIEGADNVTFTGLYQTLVFEGPYKNAKTWYDQALAHARESGKEAKEVYFFYTTCPKCSKHYGKNYVITMAKVA